MQLFKLPHCFTDGTQKHHSYTEFYGGKKRNHHPIFSILLSAEQLADCMQYHAEYTLYFNMIVLPEVEVIRQ